METKSGQILRRVLNGNRGKQLTIDEIIELSKKDEYSIGHPHFSKKGISRSFVHNQMAIFHNKWKDLFNDPFSGVIADMDWSDDVLVCVYTNRK